jgi:serine/threonine protein kinase
LKKPIPFGKYLLVERISVGGMAEIFLAKNLEGNGERRVAIKRILPSMSEDADFTRMFLDEARICVQLNHPSIVQISDLGVHEGAYYIAMEYVAGKDLRSLMDRQQPIPIPAAVFIATRLCNGLDYAHRRADMSGKPLGIIHRDVSPQNVLLTYAGDIKLIDFGIAKAASNSQRTQAGFLKGKIGYMSPEQIVGSIDHRADLFAVGIILFEMLTGERLFTGPTDFAVLAKIRAAEVPSPRKINSAIPPALERVILKALQADPDQRYQWCSELEEDLQRFLLNPDGSLFTAKALSASLQEIFQDEFERETERNSRFAQAQLLPDDEEEDDDEIEEEDEDMSQGENQTGESPLPDYEEEGAAGADDGLEGECDDSEEATVAIMGLPIFDDDEDDEDEVAAVAPPSESEPPAPAEFEFKSEPTPEPVRAPVTKPAPARRSSTTFPLSGEDTGEAPRVNYDDEDEATEVAVSSPASPAPLSRHPGRSATMEAPASMRPPAPRRRPVRAEPVLESETPPSPEEAPEAAIDDALPALRSRSSQRAEAPRRSPRRLSASDSPSPRSDSSALRRSDRPFGDDDDAPAQAEAQPFASGVSLEDDAPAVDPFQKALSRSLEDDDADQPLPPTPAAVSLEDDDTPAAPSAGGSPADQENIRTVFGLQAQPNLAPSPAEEAGATMVFTADMLPKFEDAPAPEEAGATMVFNKDMLPKFDEDPLAEEAGATMVFTADMLPKFDENPLAEEAGATRVFTANMLPKFADEGDDENEATSVSPPPSNMAGGRSSSARPPARGGRSHFQDYDDEEGDDGEDFDDPLTPQPPPKKSKAPLIAMLLVLLVLGGGGAGFYVLKVMPPPPGELLVTLEPETAQLELQQAAGGGEPTAAPLSKEQLALQAGQALVLPPGSYTIVAKAEGYEAHEPIEVQIISKQTTEKQIRLKEIPPPPPPKPKLFTLKIETKPEGAVVELNGEEKGKTPLTLSDIDPEVVKSITLKADGYLDKTATIEWPELKEDDAAPRELPLDYDLEPVPVVKRAAASKSKPKPPPAPLKKEEKASEKPAAAAPPAAVAKNADNPAPAAKPAKAAAPEKKAEAPKPAEAKPAKEPAEAKPAKADKPAAGKTGKLIAATKPPGADISIDGEPTGRKTPVAPKKPISLPIGDHIVVFTAPDGKTAIRSISVKENETVKLTGVEDFN